MYTENRASGNVPTYRLYRERGGESGDFWLHCETIPARTHLHNFEITQHRHDGLFQIFLITEGSGELRGKDQTSAFAAPCVLFIPHGAEHGFRYRRDVDGIVVTALAERLRSVADADRQIADFTAAVQVVDLPQESQDAADAIRSLERIAAELDRPAVGRVILLEALMTSAIVSLARLAGDGAAENALAMRDRVRVDELMRLIGEHMRAHRPVAFYARELGLSQTHLNRMTRQVTGLSVQALVSRRLVEAARRDLVFTPSPVQKIAYSLGFSDAAYFNRFFRRQTGMTPGAFREAERRMLTA